MIGRLEGALARVIDGGVASLFRMRVQPADIGRRLEHALLDSRRTSTGRVIVANHYAVALHPDDFAPFAEWSGALARELESWLAEVAYQHGVSPLGPLRVDVGVGAGVRERSVEVAASFVNDLSAVASPSAPLGRLIPLAGPGEILYLRAAETTVGRAASNDLVLHAPEVSRLHARLRCGRATLDVQDLGSRNGTWVNGVRGAAHRARSGDEIAFGSLRFRLDLP